MTGHSGAAVVAGVAGNPVRHSLSPAIHTAWIAASGLDAVYVPFAPPPDGFTRFANGLRGAAIRGLNVTIPFKGEALALADIRSRAAERAGAANLLVFRPDGVVEAGNTDGIGLLGAFGAQAPGCDLSAGPVVVLGAGGAGRAAAAALADAGCPEVRLVNRTEDRARRVADDLGAGVRAFGWEALNRAGADAVAVVNATSIGLGGVGSLADALDVVSPSATVMDMVYKPLETGLLARARAEGRAVVDGLEMLIRQAAPSFEAFYGQAPPASVDVRGAALARLGAGGRDR